MQDIVDNSKKGEYKNIINCYHKGKKRVLGPKVKELPLPLIQCFVEKRKKILTSNNTALLRNASSFYEIAIKSNLETQPIYYYYSFLYFSSFISNTFLRFSSKSPSHGLKTIFSDSSNNLYDRNLTKVKIKNIIEEDIYVIFHKFGSFQRFVDTLSLIGYQSIFSMFYIQSHELNSQNLHYLIFNKEQRQFKFQNDNHFKIHENKSNTNYSKTISKYSLRVLCNYDLDKSINEATKYHGHDVSLYDVSLYLLSFLIIFVASNIARYKPYLWNIITRGEGTNIYTVIEDAYDNYSEFLYEFKGFIKTYI